MKNSIFIALAIVVSGCASVAKTLNSGRVEATNYKETISFNYDNNLAVIPVVINGKTYNFLVDTGAPTVISTAIYESLPAAKPINVNVKDSQGQVNSQKITVVPEIFIGNLKYTQVGAVVADLREVFEFNCMQLDGIIGANQMAKSFWKFDYQNKEITITDQLTNDDLRGYTASVPFSVSSQKTPYVQLYVQGIKTRFTYDTGAAGFVDFHDKTGVLNNKKGYTRYGSSDIGLYGSVDSVTTRTVRVDSIRLGNMTLRDQVIDVETDNLLGNKFMNHYEVVIDWKQQNLHFKEVKKREKQAESSFGFTYRFVNNKAVVSRLIKELPTDLKLGDIIESINDYDLSNLTDALACERYLTLKLKNVDTLNVRYTRNDTTYTTTIQRQVLPE